MELSIHIEDGKARPDVASRIFDRQTLCRHTMNDPQLELEVLSLFLDQISRLEQVNWQALDMGFEMHTLRGSAAAVGADQITQIAAHWKDYGDDLVPRLVSAFRSFRAEARQI